MWFFNTRKKIAKTDLLQGFTDWHSHILPGVDDGVGSMDESLAILREYEAAGVSTVWLTPHIMEDIPNTTDGLRQRYTELCAAYDGPIKLRLAAENMLDNLFERRLEARDLLTIGDSGDHLLVETSYFTPPSDMDDKLQRIKIAGYFPVLAHPERYIYMDNDDYEYLHRHDVKMQLNLSSLFGFYGSVPEKKAHYLLNKGYYNAIGSDTHRIMQVQSMIGRGTLPTKYIDKIKMIEGIW